MLIDELHPWLPQKVTYAEVKLASADIVASDVDDSRGLPLLLGLLDLSAGADIDNPVTIFVGIASGIDGHLVIGEGVGRCDSILHHLQLARSLADLRLSSVIVHLLLALPLQVQVL